MTGPLTDEQAIHAIWGLLSEDERPEGFIAPSWDHDYFRVEEGWSIIALPNKTAHRAILDAAREVLDLAGVEINPPGDGNSGWVWYTDEEFCTDQEDVYDTRTQCTYHALAWLKGRSE